LIAEKTILNKPEPFVGIQQMTENGLEVKVRCWVKTADYGQVFYSTQQQVFEALQAGAFPFFKA
jgi:small-conductance mechanosensitive channel